MDELQNNAIPQSNIETPIPQPAQNHFLKSKLFIIVAILAFLAVTTASASFLLVRNASTKKEIKKIAQVIKPTPTALPTPTPEDSSILTASLSGHIMALGDLKLMIIQGNNPAISDPSHVKAHYYSAGTYTNGPYTGYTRIFALQPGFGEGSSACGAIVFATKDNKTYILSGDPTQTQLSSDYFKSNYNPQLVTSIAMLPSSFPQTISVDNNFGLLARDVYYHYQYNQTSPGECTIIADYSSYSKLPFTKDSFTFYEEPTPDYPQDNHYYKSPAELIAVDSTGLANIYSISFNSTLQKYMQYVAKENLFLQKKGPEPTDADRVYDPNLALKNTDITTQEPLYKTYDHEQDGCAIYHPYITKNIADNDIVQIGSINSNNLFIYTLKDSNHPLYQRLFKSLSTGFRPTQTPITISEYAKSHPVIILKDPLNHLIVLTESEKHISPGCGGKPVLYFYPQKDTHVTVSFDTLMDLNLTIPFYTNKWDILAHSSGVLEDLQPQYSPCNSIDTTAFGSEYAKAACAKNKYPYLYWAGTPKNNLFPVPTEGWTVQKNQIEPFLRNSLTRIGLTHVEQNDMVEYWLPTLNKTQAPYFHISFLQTSELNQLVPMQISPKPDTFMRVFLSWYPLYKKTTTEPNPQLLTPIERKGFTVVEWGGMKY